MNALGATSAPATCSAAQAQRHVLVVDDEQDLAKQLAHGLSILGYTVVVVFSASEARLQLAARPDIVVVVTDVRLSGEDGLALAEEISRETDERRAREVVVISGNASTEDAARAERAGASDFLTKPFRLHEIAKAVEVAANRAEARRRRAPEQDEAADGPSDGEVTRETLLARLEQANAELTPQIASGAVPHDVAQCAFDVSQGLRALGAAAFPVSGVGEAPLQGLRDMADGVARLEELVRAFGPAASGPRSSLQLNSLATEVLNRVSQAHPDCAWRIVPASSAISVLAERSRLERILELCLEAVLACPDQNNARYMRLSTVGGADGEWACITLLAGPDAGEDEPPEAPLLGGESGAFAQGVAALRFFSARRLAKLEGAALLNISAPSGLVALRLSLPLQRVK
jgi:CheY-like chemotaxis protein